MTDIVERLRRFGRLANPPLLLAMDAADEIERLREALEAVVRRYACGDTGWPMEDMREIARRALEGARKG